MVRKPPDILITTPESLHLMLTSRARDILRGISHVIVDEIHAVCGNKRGVFLALLLERLEAINPASFVRIGLSATQRPLDEVARYLGGSAEPWRPARRWPNRGPLPSSTPAGAATWTCKSSGREPGRPSAPVRSGRRSSISLLTPGGRAPLDDRLRQQPADWSRS